MGMQVPIQAATQLTYCIPILCTFGFPFVKPLLVTFFRLHLYVDAELLAVHVVLRAVP